MNPNIIIDGKNLAYRMFSTLDLTNDEGDNVSAVFGTISAISRMVETFGPRRVVVCWDTKTSALWRRKIYPPYKMNRKKNREGEENIAKMADFEEQQDLIQLALSWLPIYQIVENSMEADDLIYLLTQRLFKEQNNIVVSTDKDMLQLINKYTSIWSPIKQIAITDGSKETVRFYKDRRKKVTQLKEYVGVPIEQFIDFKVLQGDTSDNIAGVEGIGEKTAIKLLEQYGSIEEMYKNKEEMSKSARNKRVVEDEQMIRDLVSIMDISQVEEHLVNPIGKLEKGIIKPSESYKKFWNFARDNDFKTIFMNYRHWCKPFEEMGIQPIPFRRKRKPRGV